MKMIVANKKNMLSIAIITVMVAVLLSPQEYIASVFAGLLVYVKNVLPALFPFIFFTKVLSALGSANALSISLDKPMRRIFHAPSTTAYIMLMSMLCGYPIGAKLVRDHYSSGYLTSHQAEKITAISSTVGPIFLIGTVGTMLLGNKSYGYIIFCAHIIASLITAIIMRERLQGDDNSCKPIPPKADNILANSMSDSILSVLAVGGYIAIMCIFIEILDQVLLLDVICEALSTIGLPTSLTKGVICGLMEMTCGVTILSSGHLPPAILLSITAFITSFGGLCIHLQSMNYLSSCHVRYSRFFCHKLLQSCLTSVITLLLTLIFI